MKVLVIDNYDSFTFNLVQLLGSLNCRIIVKKNDAITIDQVMETGPDKILISPGPKKPGQSGISLQIIKRFGEVIPILGVCLGHQVIVSAYGGKVVKCRIPVHGKISKILHDGKTIFRNIPQEFDAMRYHSLIVDENSLPDELRVSARTNQGLIMAIRHKFFPVEGIQFHPESVLTKSGEKIIANWLKL